MTTEMVTGDPARLSPRAGIALLTLQVRAALRDADEAEREDAGWSGDSAADELRQRLDALLDDHRSGLDLELAEARAAAVERVRGVQVELDAMRVAVPEESAAPTDIAARDHEAGPSPVTFEPDLDRPDASAAEPEADVPPPHVAGSSADPMGCHGESDAAWSEPAPGAAGPLTADDVRFIVDEALARFAGQPNPQAGAADPDAMARAIASAFGAAFGAMMDERLAGAGSAAMVPVWQRTAPQQTVMPSKSSFWTNMWHADVMLSVLAALIVVVILIAWST